MGILISSPQELAAVQSSLGAYDITDLYDADSGREYYMNMPHGFVLRSVLRLTLVSLVLALFSCGIILFPIVPCYVIHFFKIHVFIKWCRTVNISSKKLWVFFVAELLLFEIAAVFIRGIIIDRLMNADILGLFEMQRWLGI